MKDSNKIAWINCAKFIAILAVLTDHTYGMLYTNRDIAMLSYFSVSLFILLLGQTVYISISKYQLRWFKTFIKLSINIVTAYCFCVFVYLIVMLRFFDMNTYLHHLLYFNISSPHYYVFLHLQLAVAAKTLWHIVSFDKGRYAIIWEVLLVIPLILVSYFTMNYTNMFYIPAGGGKLFGGTYLILFYLGMLMQKYYHYWGGQSIIKSVVISISSVLLAILWWRFECVDNFQIDSLVPFGYGFNPPSITSSTMAIIMLFATYGIVTLLEQCRYTRFITRFVSWLGGYTMYIFLYHRLFLDFMLVSIPFSNIWIKRLVYWGTMIAGPVLIAVSIKLVKKGCRIITDNNNSDLRLRESKIEQRRDKFEAER